MALVVRRYDFTVNHHFIQQHRQRLSLLPDIVRLKSLLSRERR